MDTTAWGKPLWRHKMETFSALLAICAGNSPAPGEFPVQRPVTRSFDVFLDLRLNNWINNREAGDLRRHRSHYDVIVMVSSQWTSSTIILIQISLKIVLLVSNHHRDRNENSNLGMAKLCQDYVFTMHCHCHREKWTLWKCHIYDSIEDPEHFLPNWGRAHCLSA